MRDPTNCYPSRCPHFRDIPNRCLRTTRLHERRSPHSVYYMANPYPYTSGPATAPRLTPANEVPMSPRPEQRVTQAPTTQVPATKPLGRYFLTFLELCVLGTLGWAAVTVVALLAGLGLGLLPVLGIGLLFLVGLVYALYGVGAFEVLRVDGLYRLGVEPVPFSSPRGPGFKEWVRSLLTQLGVGRMWVALGSFILSVLIGSAVVSLVSTAASWIPRAISQFVLISQTAPADYGSLYWMDPSFHGGSAWFDLSLANGIWWHSGGPLFNLVGALLALLAAAALVYLSRTVSIAIISSSARATQLSKQARSAQMQAQANFMQREGAVRAAEVERARIERDLHDGVQPRLVSVAMTLDLAQKQIDADPAKAKDLVSEAHTSTKAAITELRQLARGVHASVLDDRGLDAALSALVGRSPVPTRLDVRLVDGDGVQVTRVSREAETAVYFSIAESLTNAAKHSHASECRITVRLRSNQNPAPSAPRTGLLWARVEDDGVGGARVTPGGGLDGIINRVNAAGGSVRLDSPNGGPTSLEVSVPCAF